MIFHLPPPPPICRWHSMYFCLWFSDMFSPLDMSPKSAGVLFLHIPLENITMVLTESVWSKGECAMKCLWHVPGQMCKTITTTEGGVGEPKNIHCTLLYWPSHPGGNTSKQQFWTTWNQMLLTDCHGQCIQTLSTHGAYRPNGLVRQMRSDSRRWYMHWMTFS